MGNQNKQRDLYNQINNSNPILLENVKQRPCKIKEGKIVQNFNHYEDEYNSLNKHLEKLKNQMNLVISNDALEIIEKRLEELNKLTINNEIKNSISSFCLTYKNNLKNYYSYIENIKKVYKETYLLITNLLTSWLKEQHDINLQSEESKVQETLKNMNEVVNNFGKFSEVIDLINQICYFEIDYKSQDKFNLIDKYYNEKKEEIKNNYNFENLPQFRSLINLRDLLIENISQKNSFAEVLENFHAEYLALYKIIIEKINSSVMDKYDIVNEFNEYNSVIIYHRLIRSTEEKLKLIKLD